MTLLQLLALTMAGRKPEDAVGPQRTRQHMPTPGDLPSLTGGPPTEKDQA